MTKVKFIKFGANSAFGGFAPGDVLTCADELARHLVLEAQVAEYAQPKQAPTEEQAPAEVPAPRKTRKKA